MPKVRKGRTFVWVEPKLVCEVEFAEWTHERASARLRRIRGCATTSPARAVHREQPRREVRRTREALEPREGVLARRGDHQGRPARLLHRARRAGDPCPTFANRPFTMRPLSPDGIAGKGVLSEGCAQAHAGVDSTLPRRGGRRARSRASASGIEAPIVNDEDALLWAANMAVHRHETCGNSRVDRPDRPDFRASSTSTRHRTSAFKETIQVALLVKDALDALGLVSFAKTSSCRRPCTSSYRSENAATRSTTPASSRRSSPAQSHATHRGLATTEWSKAKRRGGAHRLEPERRGKDDRLRVTPCVRRPGAPVSTTAALGRGERESRPVSVHDGTWCSSVCGSTATLFAGVLTTRQRLDKALAALR